MSNKRLKTLILSIPLILLIFASSYSNIDTYIAQLIPSDSTTKEKSNYKILPNKRKVDKPSEYGSEVPKLPKGYTEENKLDSVQLTVKNSETFSGLEITPAAEYDLDDYLKIRKKQIQTKIWDSLSSRYDLKQALSGNDLQRMIGQATGMTIPLPPNPILGLFGKPEVSINVNGEEIGRAHV